MPDIKTRDIAKGTIKTIDKSAVAAERMKSAFIQTKEKAEHSVDVPERSAEEYASNRLESGIDRVSHEAVHQFDKQGRKYTNLTSRGARAFRRQSRISSRQRTVFRNSRKSGRRSRFKNRRRRQLHEKASVRVSRRWNSRRRQ